MAEEKMNLAALQQRDPYISEILDTASQVALYLFNANANEWEKTSIEGSLFIYKRSASPLTGFIILNRLGLNNLVEPITKDLEFQQQEPFLLYRNSKSIYGVWFYDKEECKRLGGKLNCYVQEMLGVDSNKQTSPSVVGGNKMVGGTTLKESMKIVEIPVSQVDIMQMLSKAQLEYDTGSKKGEPNLMKDDLNALATKTTNFIQSLPLKRPDSDCVPPDDASLRNLLEIPGIISLDTLFRTARLQRGTLSLKPINASKTLTVESCFPPDPGEAKLKTSVSMSATSTDRLIENQTKSDGNDLPPLLRQIMPMSSMVEDIERLHIRPKSEHLGSRNDGYIVALPGVVSGIPDFSQPPPTHPAYRGPSPQTQAQNEHSDKGNRFESTSSVINVENVKGLSNVPTGPSSCAGSVLNIQIPSGNLVPLLNNAKSFSHSIISSLPVLNSTTSLSQYSQQNIVHSSSSLKMATDTFSGSLVSSGSDGNWNSQDKVEYPAMIKSVALLTPADLVQPSALYSSSAVTTAGIHSSMSGVYPVYERSVSTGLSLATSTLTTELLSPMAFISTTRKIPSVVCSVSAMTEKSLSHEERLDQSRDSENLRVAALTKEQLQQALVYLLKNDSNFINMIHEAYLKSLYELSRPKP